MKTTEELFPSLKTRPKRPYGWMQWKGTDACMDLNCSCGALLHIDGDFIYHIKCGECKQVFEVGGFVKLYPLDFEPEGTKECTE